MASDLKPKPREVCNQLQNSYPYGFVVAANGTKILLRENGLYRVPDYVVQTPLQAAIAEMGIGNSVGVGWFTKYEWHAAWVAMIAKAHADGDTTEYTEDDIQDLIASFTIHRQAQGFNSKFNPAAEERKEAMYNTMLARERQQTKMFAEQAEQAEQTMEEAL